jgi:hypothetical protein
LYILNRDNFEPNTPHPDFKGTGTEPNSIQQINTTSLILITVRDTYFLLDIDKGGIRYIANESWKKILPNYYSEIFHNLQEKESAYVFDELQEKQGGHVPDIEYNTSRSSRNY